MYYKIKYIMLIMGFDFMYENVNFWYKNLDKFIKYVNVVSIGYCFIFKGVLVKLI